MIALQSAGEVVEQLVRPFGVGGGIRLPVLRVFAPLGRLDRCPIAGSISKGAGYAVRVNAAAQAVTQDRHPKTAVDTVFSESSRSR
jgi:hypothetical protein